ncbi:hypothetical protein, partial [Helicobacter sp. T3_23-1059]
NFINNTREQNKNYKKDTDTYIEYSIQSFYETKQQNGKNTNTHEFYTKLIEHLCSKLGLKSIDILFASQMNKKEYGEYARKHKDGALVGGKFEYYKNNTIVINNGLIKKQKMMLMTIFHEIRHYYIDQKKISQPDGLSKYVLNSYAIYFDNNDKLLDSIFKMFIKKCNADDKNMVNCDNRKEQNIYELQPNERDPRYVATQIVKTISQGK